MECFVVFVIFGALLNESSTHLKRQANIDFLVLIIIIQGCLLHISSYCLDSLVSSLLQLYSVYNWLYFKC
jgi:hypothetical protein